MSWYQTLNRGNKICTRSFIIVLVSLVFSSPLLAELTELTDKGWLRFTDKLSEEQCESNRDINAGCIRSSKDLSAIGQVGPYLVIGGDEAAGPNDDLNIIQLLLKQVNGEYRVHEDIVLPDVDGEGEELDIEGIAVDGNFIYVVGSHSSVRKKTDSEKTVKKNREKFTKREIKNKSARDWLHRVEVSQQGRELSTKSISLSDVISSHEVLKTFSKIPGKENGVNIEGISFHDGSVYVGFRGPVFRDNYVPVLKFIFDEHEESAELLWVKLDGGGIRGMANTGDGFLLVSGPVGDAPGPYQVYHWNGQDMVPGKDRDETEDHIKKLGNLEVDEGKAEGILALQDKHSAGKDCQYEFMIIFDGAFKGNPSVYCFSEP